jgi:NitT/TauT family transport system substrate-binding protein
MLPIKKFWVRNYQITVTLTLLLVIALASCTNTETQNKAQPLRIGWSDWAGDYLFVLADVLGLYEKYRVDVTLVYQDSYHKNVVQLAAGSIDTTNLQIGDALLLNEATDVKIVAAIDSSAGADIVMATGIVKSPADLGGKRFGVQVGSISSEVFISEMLQQYGLSMQDITLVNMPPERVPASLGYYIDAGHTWAPYDQDAIRLGYQAIFDSSKSSGVFMDVLAFRTSLLQDRPDQIRAVVSAVLEAAKFWKNNPEDGNRLIATYLSNLGQPTLPEDVAATGVLLFDDEDNSRIFSGGLEPGTLLYATQLTLDYMVRTGGISRPVNLEIFLDPSFLPLQTRP